MSLRDRIEAKTRRTTAFPLQVGDAVAAQAEVRTFRAALEVHLQAVKDRQETGGVEPTDADHERTEALRKQLREAQVRQAETVAMVELQALPADVFDEVLDPLPEPVEGEGYDLTPVRATLLAACCTDESLRDESWWEQQLARPEYTKGDLLSINHALLALNMNVPDGTQGKG